MRAWGSGSGVHSGIWRVVELDEVWGSAFPMDAEAIHAVLID
jgi:hypothetical protein